MQFVKSRQNKTIKEVISLKEKKNRRKLRRFIIEGYRFIHEAISSGVAIEKVFFSSDTEMKFRHELMDKLNPGIHLYEITPELFLQIAETDSPQGVLAVVQNSEQNIDAIYIPGFRGLVLDSIQDPGNAGTMIRSAHALGFNAVVTTEGTVDVFNSKVLRSTMGSIFYIPVLENMKSEDIFFFCRENSLRVISSRLEDAKPCNEVDLKADFLLVIGNEGNGISEYFHNNSSAFAKIPMPGGAESFNAAVAASILMYESNRQRDCIKR